VNGVRTVAAIETDVSTARKGPLRCEASVARQTRRSCSRRLVPIGRGAAGKAIEQVEHTPAPDPDRIVGRKHLEIQTNPRGKRAKNLRQRGGRQDYAGSRKGRGEARPATGRAMALPP
jgi:hypothetical protein